MKLMEPNPGDVLRVEGNYSIQPVPPYKSIPSILTLESIYTLE